MSLDSPHESPPLYLYLGLLDPYRPRGAAEETPLNHDRHFDHDAHAAHAHRGPHPPSRRETETEPPPAAQWNRGRTWSLCSLARGPPNHHHPYPCVYCACRKQTAADASAVALPPRRLFPHRPRSAATADSTRRTCKLEPPYPLQRSLQWPSRKAACHRHCRHQPL